MKSVWSHIGSSDRILSPVSLASDESLSQVTLPGYYRVPIYIPGWREAIMVKCLAHGHKHHGRGRDLNPHSGESAVGTQTRCA